MERCFDVLIIGTGAAGYAVADRLYGKGVRNICVVADRIRNGTSRNAGSDKQTYYKTDISSDYGDSVRKMAEDYFAGGAMHGDDAMLEAANSLRCFFYLVEAGVPFPKDRYGIYHGYRTDHDNTNRATSVGPLTSARMTEVLERKVREEKIPVLDGYSLVRLAVRDGICYGAFFLHGNGIERVCAENTVLCTGAPAAVYADSVYPVGQTGATGIAVQAGAALQNFQEWQYGIASLDFRWNLSGSYQQVIPRYFSVDTNGNETEFLRNEPDIFTKIFLKGYEWPFNSAKTEGSSLIDILVMREIKNGRKVYLDYTRNPSGFDFSELRGEAYEYLRRASVDGKTPFERLRQLNPAAIELYAGHGIFLDRMPLAVGVCAQHNNGGIRVDENGETSVGHLFCAGEASGRFGICRPGGAALNDTQVGALLISDHIAKTVHKTEKKAGPVDVPFPVLPALSAESNLSETDAYYARAMSDYAGAVRDTEQIGKLLSQLRQLDAGFDSAVTIKNESEYEAYFAFMSATKARIALCATELESALFCGSRGGCICLSSDGMIPENSMARQYVTVTDTDGIRFEPVRPIPDTDCVFEILLKENKN